MQAICRFSKAAAAKKVALEQELSQTRAVHVELQSTADAFRRLQKERQDSVAQQEQTLEAVSRYLPCFRASQWISALRFFHCTAQCQKRSFAAIPYMKVPNRASWMVAELRAW